MRRDELTEVVPLARRVVQLDGGALLRLRRSSDRLAALVRLPFDVVAARTIALGGTDAAYDVTVAAADLVAWLEGARPDRPPSRDADWRWGAPPAAGWRRVDTVPEAEVRAIVRRGAQALREAAERTGGPGAQPRAALTDAALDSVVLSVSDGPLTAPVRLRSLSAVTRLGFLAPGSDLAVDVAGRWIRLAAAYGSVYAERPGLGLGLAPR